MGFRSAATRHRLGRVRAPPSRVPCGPKRHARLLLGLFGFVGFFVAVSLLVTRIGLVSAFGIALLVNLLIHGAA